MLGQDPPAVWSHPWQHRAGATQHTELLWKELRCRGSPGSPHLSDGVGDILIDGVGDLGSLHSRLELHGQHAGVVPQPPVVGLVPGQARAVDAGLLPRADPDHLRHRVTHSDQSHAA